MLDDRIAELEDENAALQQENAALRAALDAQMQYQRHLRDDRDRLDWLEASEFWPASLDFWPHHLPQTGGNLRAAIAAARKEAQQ